MTNSYLLEEIRDQNLTYLMLAQKLIREDREESMFRLGISEDVADLISAMSTAQVLQAASGNMLLCQMRNAEDRVWSLLTNHSGGKVENQAGSRIHASIVMAGRMAATL